MTAFAVALGTLASLAVYAYVGVLLGRYRDRRLAPPPSVAQVPPKATEPVQAPHWAH